jgi:hypothetical protein
MTVNMLHRVPAGVEQPSRPSPVRFFLTGSIPANYRQARLIGAALHEATFTCCSRMDV